MGQQCPMALRRLREEIYCYWLGMRFFSLLFSNDKNHKGCIFCELVIVLINFYYNLLSLALYPETLISFLVSWNCAIKFRDSTKWKKFRNLNVPSFFLISQYYKSRIVLWKQSSKCDDLLQFLIDIFVN